MNPTAALILCLIVVAVLLRLERTRNPAASGALWVPTCWMLISGSKPVGRWMGLDVQSVDGSVWDRLVLSILIFFALVIVRGRRKNEWSRALKDNRWVILLFLYMGSSILWVDDPFVSLKRWIKSAGVVVMALVILSERKPLEAFGSVLRRCAYILIPLSIVLIKYFPELGRAYHHWSGVLMWTGVTTHKNSLGQLCAVSAFFLIWALFRKGRARGPFRTRSHVYADGFVLGMAVYLLVGPGAGAYSATSIAIVVVGVATFVVLDRKESLARLIAANVKVIAVGLVLMYLLFADAVITSVTAVMGRDDNLTGRATDIWPVVLEAAARHPVLGAGYGGVWGLGGEISSKVGVGQAHNGYLDVYLELGIVGIVLLSAFFLNFCSRIRRQFSHELDWGVFGFCFLLITLLYNLTESAFFDVYLGTTMVLLSVVFSACLQPKADDPQTSGRELGRGRERLFRRKTIHIGPA